MTSIPHLMQAVLAETKGESLRLVQVATPRPGAGEVLVQVAASGVNPLVTKILAGIATHARQSLPAILGIDVAGVVVAAGKDATQFQSGDAVYGMAGGVGGYPGSLAEYMAVDCHLLARKPVNLTMREAAVLPLVFITAWEGLVNRAGIRAGQHVLVRGAILAQASKLAELGALVPALDPRRFSLGTVGEAYRAIEAGTARGKLVIDVREEAGS